MQRLDWQQGASRALLRGHWCDLTEGARVRWCSGRWTHFHQFFIVLRCQALPVKIQPLSQRFLLFLCMPCFSRQVLKTGLISARGSSGERLRWKGAGACIPLPWWLIPMYLMQYKSCSEHNISWRVKGGVSLASVQWLNYNLKKKKKQKKACWLLLRQGEPRLLRRCEWCACITMVMAGPWVPLSPVWLHSFFSWFVLT